MQCNHIKIQMWLFEELVVLNWRSSSFSFAWPACLSYIENKHLSFLFFGERRARRGAVSVAFPQGMITSTFSGWISLHNQLVLPLFLAKDMCVKLLKVNKNHPRYLFVASCGCKYFNTVFVSPKWKKPKSPGTRNRETSISVPHKELSLVHT